MRRSFHAALLAEPERFLLTVDADAAEPMLRSALCRSCPEHPPVGGNSDTWLDIGSMGPFLAEFLSDRLVALHPSFLSAGALQGETYLPLRLLHEPRTRVILHTGGNHFCVARLHGSSGGDNEPSSHGVSVVCRCRRDARLTLMQNQSGGRDSDDTTSGGHGSPDSLSLPPPQEWWRRAARAFQTNAWVSLGQH
ncbi:hypothetical protein FA09DRAFT_331663 [Tilletiopsis washingtonensis]|uniref:Uncharacterized protein n=1 Tax=Tilletiopsis washingtonensis TaxID=58919 RepID=A0A316Z544_9BASI|nr:hypothetical protein FA09DRAFT_331663 [Tilletiopsis washingtonensis]PWN96078.1 hypothetical protein FA09DRAFT_331663 [Tilletiopsis washingtonensis]